ncbi:MAG: hypothetical protein AAB593_01020 [Patescibacteria group bacterium]
MKKRTVIISIIIAFIVLYIFFIFNKGDNNITDDFLYIDFAQQDEFQEASLEQEKANNVKTTSSKNDIYINNQYGFSFEHPITITVGAFKDEDGDTVLIQEKNGSKSVQIFIIPFDEQGPISKERILQDLPNIVIKDKREGILSGDKAISFFSKHETIGDTFEVWFISNNNLYQIITKAETFRFLADIMKTWKKDSNI